MNKKVFITCKIRKSNTLLLIMIIIYILLLSYISVLRHESFTTGAFDLGIFTQAFSTTINERRFLYNSVENWPETGFITGNYLGRHFSPILLIILPFFALFPLPQTLLIIQSIIIAFTAVPIFIFAKENLKSDIAGLCMSAAYLMHPAVLGVNLFDFHHQAFFPLLMMSAIVFMFRKKWKLFWLMTILCLMVIEQSGIIVFMLGIFGIVNMIHNRDIVISLSRSNKSIFEFKLIVINIKEMLNFFAICIISIIHYLLVGYIMSILEPRSYIMIYEMKLIFEPWKIPSALMSYITEKSIYVIMIFAPLLLTSFLSPFLLIPALPWLTCSLISSYKPYFTLGYQYSAFVLPFIFAASIKGLSKLKLNKPSLYAFLSLIIISSMLSLCISFTNNYFFNESVYKIPNISENDIALSEILKIIPKDVTVLAHNNIFPHIANRSNVYPVLLGGIPEATIGFLRYHPLYIILNKHISEYDTLGVISKIIDKGLDYGVVIQYDGIVLLRKHYGAKISNLNEVFSNPKLISLETESLSLARGSAQKVEGALFNPKNQHETLFIDKDSLPEGIQIFVHYPSPYRFILTINASQNTNLNICNIEIHMGSMPDVKTNLILTITDLGFNNIPNLIEIGETFSGNLPPGDYPIYRGREYTVIPYTYQDQTGELIYWCRYFVALERGVLRFSFDIDGFAKLDIFRDRVNYEIEPILVYGKIVFDIPVELGVTLEPRIYGNNSSSMNVQSITVKMLD